METEEALKKSQIHRSGCLQCQAFEATASVNLCAQGLKLWTAFTAEFVKTTPIVRRPENYA